MSAALSPMFLNPAAHLCIPFWLREWELFHAESLGEHDIRGVGSCHATAHSFSVTTAPFF